MKFRKKPIIIEAHQFQYGGQRVPGVSFDGEDAYVVTAHHQTVWLAGGEWIVPEPGHPGYFYPITDEIMKATYDQASFKIEINGKSYTVMKDTLRTDEICELAGRKRVASIRVRTCDGETVTEWWMEPGEYLVMQPGNVRMEIDV